MMAVNAELRSAILEAKRRAYRDSNDREIEALQVVVSLACSAVGLDENALDNEAFDIENKGW